MAVDLEVAELGVGHQHAVVDQRGADAGAEGGHDDQAALAARGAVLDLGQPGGVGVVDDVHLAPGRLGEQRVGVGADPGLVDVGGRAHDAVADDAGHGDADRRVESGNWSSSSAKTSATACGVAGCGVSMRTRSAAKSPTVEVDRRALDAGAAEVDAEGVVAVMATILPSPDAAAACVRLDRLTAPLVKRFTNSYGHVNPDRRRSPDGRLRTRLAPTARSPQGSTEHWRDQKRYLWLIGLVVPSLAFIGYGGSQLTGWGAWFWIGPVVILGIVPAIDLVAGLDRSNPPDDVIEALEKDRYYRWITYLFLPIQYAGFVGAMYLIARGRPDPRPAAATSTRSGWRSRSAASAASASTPPTSSATRRRPTSAGCPRSRWRRSFYGHFYIEHNRGHHVRVATPEDPASARGWARTSTSSGRARSAAR